MALYKFQTMGPGSKDQFIIKKGPPDRVFKENPNNPNWVEYKAWVDAGNTTEAAD